MNVQEPIGNTQSHTNPSRTNPLQGIKTQNSNKNTTNNVSFHDNNIYIEIQEITLLYLIMSHKTVLTFFNMIQNQLLLHGYYPDRKILLTLNDSESKYKKYSENLHKYYRDLLYKEKVIFKSDLNNSLNNSSKPESTSTNREFKEKSTFKKDDLKSYFDFFSAKSFEFVKLNEEVKKKLKKNLKNDELYNYYNKINDILENTGTKESKSYANLRDDIKILKKIIKTQLEKQLEKHNRILVKTKKNSNTNSNTNQSNINTTEDYKKMFKEEKKEFIEKNNIYIKFTKPENNDITSISNMMINFYNTNETKGIKEDLQKEFKKTQLSKFVDIKMKDLISLRLLMDSTYDEELRKTKEQKKINKLRKREIFRDLNIQVEHSFI